MRDLPKCRYCGCDELHACPGGCSWYRPGYCSACAKRHLSDLVASILEWLTPDRREQLCEKPVVETSIGNWPAKIQYGEESDGLPQVWVIDHIGCPAIFLTPDGVTLSPHYTPVELLPLFATEQREAA